LKSEVAELTREKCIEAIKFMEAAKSTAQLKMYGLVKN